MTKAVFNQKNTPTSKGKKSFSIYALFSTMCFFLLTSSISYAENAQLDETLLESSELMQSGKVIEALSLLKNTETEYSDSREYLNNLAVAYLGNSRPEEALSILRQLVDNDPLYSIITHNLLEMELQISESRPENIKPVLFVQTVDSFFTREVEQIQTPETQRADISSSDIDSENETPPFDQGEQQKAQHEIIAKTVVNHWARAWSIKDYSAYSRIYSSIFIGPAGQNYEQWISERRIRLSKPGAIDVSISKLSVNSAGADIIIATFDQDYSSANYSDRVQKELTLIRENADWRIIKETTLNTY